MLIYQPIPMIIKNRWDISLSFIDARGNASNLVQSPPFADFYQAFSLTPINLRVGSGISLQGTAGVAIVTLFGSITGDFKASSNRAVQFPYRYEIGLLDSAGERTTYALLPVQPIDPRFADVTETISVPQARVSLQVTVPAQ